MAIIKCQKCHVVAQIFLTLSPLWTSVSHSDGVFFLLYPITMGYNCAHMVSHAKKKKRKKKKK
jgi:hypothetical protein